MDPNDAIPAEKSEKTEKTATKRKSTAADTEDKEPENHNHDKKKKKSEPKHERRHSETTVEVDGTIETHITLSPRTPPGDPPESDELVKVSVQNLWRLV